MRNAVAGPRRLAAVNVKTTIENRTFRPARRSVTRANTRPASNSATL
jgi:hypothetical protein